MDARFWVNHFYNIFEDRKKRWSLLKEFESFEAASHLCDMFKIISNYEKAIEVFEYMTYEINEMTSLNLLNDIYRITRKDERKANFFKNLQKKFKSEDLSQTTNGLLKNMNMSTSFLIQGDFDQAIKLYEEIMEVQQDTLGTKHEDYLDTKKGLACCFGLQENFSHAIKL